MPNSSTSSRQVHEFATQCSTFGTHARHIRKSCLQLFFLMSSRDRHRSATYPIIWSMHKPLEVAWSWKDSGISLGQLLSTRVPLEQASLNGRPQSSSEPSNRGTTASPNRYLCIFSWPLAPLPAARKGTRWEVLQVWTEGGTPQVKRVTGC